MAGIVPYQPQKGNATKQGTTPKNGKGIKNVLFGRGGFGGVLGAGFVGIDAISRMKEGESAPVAIGKAAISNALWAMVPGGIGTMLGLTALEMAPEAMRMYDMAKSGIGAKSVQFGGGYTQNEGQEYNKQMGMQNMMNARNSAAAMMSRHARGASKSY
jgi:hypothetical protein